MRRIVRQGVLLSLMIIVILLMAVTSPNVSAIDSNGTNLADWEYTETDDTIILTKYIGTSTDVIVPSSFSEKSEMKVGINSLQKETSVFKNRFDITSLVIGTADQKVDVIDKNMSYAFYKWENVTAINLIGLNTNQVTDMSSMFYDCYYLFSLNVTKFDTSYVVNMSYMFCSCRSLLSLDISSFDTSNVADMNHMFTDCSSLGSLNINRFDTSNVTDMNCMFGDCRNLTSLDLRNFDTSKVKNMWGMFTTCSNLISLDISKFDTSHVTNMMDMFSNCSSLMNVDVYNFNTSKVHNMSNMFKNCSSLTSLDLSHFDTRNVTDMDCMFENCSNLNNLNVSVFDTTSIIDMDRIFKGCKKLKKLDVSGFKSNPEIILRETFYNCVNLLYFDLSGWGNAIDFSIYRYMFAAPDAIMDIPTVIVCSDENEEKLKEICADSKEITNRKPSEYPKYIANGGTFGDSATEKHCFDSIVVNESKIPTTQKEVCEYFDAPKKVDKIFDGWYLEPECTTRYVSDETPIDMNKVIGEGLTLYAGWRDTEHTVSYQFVSGTDGKVLPEEVTKLIPAKTIYADSDRVKPINLTEKTIFVPGGCWNFVGYDVNEKTITEDTTFIGTWVYDSAPMITANDKTIIAGDTFNPMEGASAIDEEDGDLTNHIQVIMNNVDSRKEGTYQVTYQVIDSSGNKVVETIKVVVNKKDEPVKPNLSDNNKPNIIDNNSEADRNKIKTGDNTDIMMWLVLIILSNGCIVWMNRKRGMN